MPPCRVKRFVDEAFEQKLGFNIALPVGQGADNFAAANIGADDRILELTLTVAGAWKEWHPISGYQTFDIWRIFGMFAGRTD